MPHWSQLNIEVRTQQKLLLERYLANTLEVHWLEEAQILQSTKPNKIYKEKKTENTRNLQKIWRLHNTLLFLYHHNFVFFNIGHINFCQQRLLSRTQISNLSKNVRMQEVLVTVVRIIGSLKLLMVQSMFLHIVIYWTLQNFGIELFVILTFKQWKLLFKSFRIY